MGGKPRVILQQVVEVAMLLCLAADEPRGAFSIGRSRLGELSRTGCRWAAPCCCRTAHVLNESG